MLVTALVYNASHEPSLWKYLTAAATDAFLDSAATQFLCSVVYIHTLCLLWQRKYLYALW